MFYDVSFFRFVMFITIILQNRSAVKYLVIYFGVRQVGIAELRLSVKVSDAPDGNFIIGILGDSEEHWRDQLHRKKWGSLKLVNGRSVGLSTPRAPQS